MLATWWQCPSDGLSVDQSVSPPLGPDWNISTTVRWIAMINDHFNHWPVSTETLQLLPEPAFVTSLLHTAAAPCEQIPFYLLVIFVNISKYVYIHNNMYYLLKYNHSHTISKIENKQCWWSVTYMSNFPDRETMCSCILRRRISLRTSLAMGWQHRVCCPLHHDCILIAALSASIKLDLLAHIATSSCLGASFISALPKSEDVSSWFCGVLTLTSSDPAVVAAPEITSSSRTLSCFSTGGKLCVLLVLWFLGCAGRFGARESGSNVSVSSSLSEWVVCGSRSDVKGRKVDSEESMLPLSFSSSVCTSSK